MTQDEDFPRGGVYKRKRRHEAGTANAADGALLFDETEELKTTAARPTKREKRKLTLGILPKKPTATRKDEGRASAKLQVLNIVPLTSQTISVGMLVLGCIQNINRYDMVISLPNGLRGSVSVTNISDAYTNRLRKYIEDDSPEDGDHEQEKVLALLDMFSVGSYVVCKVKSLFTKNNFVKISLSLNPKDVNAELTESILYNQMILPAAVSGVEDHGFVMDIGFPETAAFLKMKNARKYEMNVNKGQSLQIGQVIFCAIDMPNVDFQGDRIRVVELTASPMQLVRSKVDNETVNRRALIPGSLICATINAVKSRGLLLKGHAYKALVHKDHLDKPSSSIPNGYEINQKVTGRILYVHPVSKVPYVSLRPELCALFPHSIFNGLRVWELVKDAKVTHVSKTHVEFDLRKGLRGVASRANVPHRKKLKDGSSRSCRILELNYMERCAIVSLKPADLEKECLFIENMKPGDKVQCEVTSVQAEGIKVSVGNYTGMIPNGHLDDGPVVDPESHFPIGRKLTCRVLVLYPEKNHLMVTNKKSLVTSTRPILASYKDAKPDSIVDGTIVSISNPGLVIRFYANVKGFVHRSNIVKRGTSIILSKAFKYGQTIACKIISCDLETSVLKLSLDIGDKRGTAAAIPSEEEFPVGKLVSCRVSDVTDDGLDVEVFPSGLRAFLPKMDLTDHPSNCLSLLRTYKAGDVVHDVLCFATGLPPIVSLRPTFVDWVKNGKIFQEFSQLRHGAHIPVVVQNYSTYGLFVKLLHNLKALAPSHTLDSQGLADVYESQQTLMATIRVLGQEKDEIAISVAPIDVEIEDDCTSVVFLQNYISEQAKIRRFASKSGQVGAVALASLTVGQMVDFVVGTVSPYGVVGRTNGGVRALVTNQHLPDSITSLDAGLIIKAVVLAVDFDEECAELSFLSSFVNSSTICSSHSHLVGDTMDAVCALVKKDFCLAALQVKGGIVYGYMPSKTHPNAVFDVGKLPAIGSTFKVNVNRLFKKTPIVLRDSQSSSSTAIQATDLSSVWSSSSLHHRPLHDRQSKETVLKTSSRIRPLMDFSNGNPEEAFKKELEELSKEEIYSSSTTSASQKRNKSKNDVKLDLGVDLHNYKSLDELSSIINNYLDVPDEEIFVETDPSDVESLNEEDEPNPKRKKLDRKITTKVKPIAAAILRRFRAADGDPEPGFCQRINIPSMKTQPHQSTNQTTDLEKQNLARLNVTTGFVWDVANISATSKKYIRGNNSSSSSSSSDNEDDDDNINKTVRKVKRNRGLSARLEEGELVRTENLLMDANRQPETADDYDRLVLSSPDASLIWLKYMAHHLQSAEFDKARSVAERALKTISFREEREKLNVWAGLLNLENQYGTKESLNDVFQRALQFNEPMKVYNLLTNIYEQSDNLDAAEKLYDVMVKRFKTELNVWIDFCTFLMNHGRLEKARKSFEKSLVVLPKVNHVMIITKFVCLEFKHGDQQRGRTMMESVANSYPRRLDVWSVYIDLVTKCGDVEGARLIYERLLNLEKGLQTRKMRSVFKKYLDFERQHGSEKTVAYVTRKATEYVEGLQQRDSDDELA